MYTPEDYEGHDFQLTHELIENYEFAILVTNHNGKNYVTHLPFIMEGKGTAHPRLVAHMAKKNPQWKTLDPKQKVTVVFQGPHSYISPRWYVDDDGENVPTWNYSAVHIEGVPHIIEDLETSFAFIQKLIARHEDNWNVDLPPEKIRAMVNEIVAFEIRDLKFESKFKMSQNRSQGDQKKVIEHLALSPSQIERDTALLMRKVLKIEN